MRTHLFMLAAAALALVACKPEEKKEEIYLTVTPESVTETISGEGGKLTFNIESNATWNIETEEWITADITSGEGDAVINIDILPNDSDKREGTILFSAISEETEVPSVSITVTQDSGKPSVTDIDGNKYEVVKIGDMWWMKENLRTTKLNDGTPIEYVACQLDWIDLDFDDIVWYNKCLQLPIYSYYEADESNIEKYGLLYNFMAANTGKLCPEGWHVPTRDEWMATIELFGEPAEVADAFKSENGWEDVEGKPGNGTNESSFSALPGGYIEEYGNWGGIGKHAYFWTSSDAGQNYAHYIQVCSHQEEIFLDYNSWGRGHSVRCVKDEQ